MFLFYGFIEENQNKDRLSSVCCCSRSHVVGVISLKEDLALDVRDSRGGAYAFHGYLIFKDFLNNCFNSFYFFAHLSGASRALNLCSVLLDRYSTSFFNSSRLLSKTLISQPSIEPFLSLRILNVDSLILK